MAIVKIQLRRDTAANWTSANPILSAGELGLETDTGRMKVGDGASSWAVLAYQSSVDSSSTYLSSILYR